MKVLFSVDEPEGLHSRARFLRYLDTLRVMGKLQGEPRLAIAHYVEDDVSVLLPVYVLDAEDYRARVLPHGWVNAQPGVMVMGVTGGRFALRHASLDLTLPPDSIAAPLSACEHTMPRGNWLRFDDNGTFWAIG